MAKAITEKLPTVIRDKCGTIKGYWAHGNHKETTCQLCRDAHAIHSAQWAKNHPEKKKTICAKYRVANPEKIKMSSAEYRIENVDKIKASSAIYTDTHREAIYATTKRWREANPEKQRAAVMRCRDAKPEKYKATRKQYDDTHPEKKRESARRRRARKRGNGFSFYTEEQVIEKHGTNCYICGEPIDMTAPRRVGKPGWQRGLHIEHVTAIDNDGRDDLENVKPSHGLCNLRKGTR